MTATERRAYYKKAKKVCFLATYTYLRRNPWVRIYHAIRSRCENGNQFNYKYYGAKGIKCLISIAEIKELWSRDRAADLARPSIDRIDPKGHYLKTNCRFIEAGENARRAHSMA